ncbi:hypothetical protein ACFL27_28315 [candidate division CSSED10-310 bacterium]|uniref:Uncharacterized protein n=1 Tax=candidate division CSSED10-310 bacterium TaxID=2855610 RepID=A0ABV6Z6N6_UNCC1
MVAPIGDHPLSFLGKASVELNGAQMEPETIIEDVSPNGNIQAFVEQDDRVTHFYLWGGPESEMPYPFAPVL